MKCFLLLCITVAISHPGFGRDDFPNDEESSDSSSNEATISGSRRTSFYANSRRCSGNMISYPGPGADGPWICGCKPRFLYFSPTNSCYEAFRQGPCPPRHYLHLALGDVFPRCAANPCIVDGLVMYKGSCFPLLQLGAPCAHNGFLYVNERTYRVECASRSRARSAAYVIVRAPPNETECPPNTLPDQSAGCKIPLP